MRRNHSRTKKILSSLLSYALVLQPLIPGVALAQLVNPQVQAGDVSFQVDGSLTTITASDGSIIGYTGFDIPTGETVQFIQPSELARVLNRIDSPVPNPSQIDGTLLANGQVYIVNPGGIFFGEGTVVDVARLVASAGSISNEDFLAGVDHFTNVEGTIENQGRIDAGTAELIGRHVQNSGLVSADELIVLAAGEDIYIGEVDGSVFVRIEGGNVADASTPGIQNSGSLSAEDGAVSLAVGDLYALAIDHSGSTGAEAIRLEGGDGGVVEVSGTLDASNDGPGESGGRIEVLGDRIAVQDAEIDASGDAGGGTIHIGGAFQGQGETRTASRTFVSEDASIRANAGTNGDGGEVVVWSEENTVFQGELEARGGAEGGDGGFAEISGAQGLSYTGRVDLRAPAGERGTLLIDPKNINVADTGANDPIDANKAFTDIPTQDVTFSDEAVEAALDGANLVLQANNDITVAAAVNSTGNTDPGDLALQAGRSIDLQQSVTLKGNFTARANDPGADPANRDPGPGNFSLGANATLDTSAVNGTVLVVAGSDLTASGAISAGAGDVSLQTQNNLAIGSVTTTGDVSLEAVTGAITDADAAVDVTAATLAARAGSGISLDTQVASLEALSQSGAIDLANTGALTLGGVDAGLTGVSLATGGGALSVTASSPLTVNEAVSNTGGGNITLAALGNAPTDDLTLNANVSATGGAGNVSLYAGDTITLTNGFTVSAANAGNVSLLAGTDFTGGVENPGNAGGAIDLANGSTVSSGSGQITLRAPADVAVSSLTTGGAALLTADSDASGAGAITDADAAVDVTAATLAARAGSGISLDTQVASLEALNQNLGIDLANTGALTLGGVDAGLTGVSIATGGSGILVTATGPLTVNETVSNAGGGGITLAAEGNSAADDLAVNANVTATGGNGVISLFAGDSITTGSNAVISAAGTGNVFLSAGTNLAGGVGANGTANGAISMADGTSVQSGSGIVTLRAPGDVAVSNVTTGGEARITADYNGVEGGLANGVGAISDAGDTATDVVAGTAALKAGSGIGTANALETQVTTLAAATQTGGIGIANTGGLTIGTADVLTGVSLATGGGAVLVTATGPLTVSEAVSNSGGGDITLAAEGNSAADDLTVNANVTATGGNGAIALFAGDTLSTGATATISAAGTGAVSLSAGTDFNAGVPQNGTNTGAIAMANGSSVQSGSGTLTLRAPADVAVSSLTTGGAAVLTADSDASGAGAITDADAAVDVTAATLAARAGSGISLDTQVASLEALSQSGAIDLANTGALTLGGVDAGLTGVRLATGGSAILVTATGPLTVNEAVSNSGGGGITLAAEGNTAPDDLAVNANVSATGGNGAIALFAGDTLSTGATATISAAGTGAVTLSAGTDFNAGVPQNGTNIGAIAMANGSSVQSGSGIVTLRAPGDVAVSNVTTGGEARITADYAGVGGGLANGAGAISDAGDTATDVVAGTAALRAGSGIGTANALETQVTTLAAATQTGGIGIANTGGVAIDTVDVVTGVSIVTGGGAVLVTATGPLTVSEDVTNAGGGNITLAAEGNSAADDLTVNANVTATGGNGAIALFAGDTITTGSNAVISAAGTGAVTLSAGTNFAGGTPANGNAAGSISMADGTSAQSSNGTLTLRAPGNVAVANVTTTGLAVVTADYAGVGGGLANGAGAISDAGDTAPDVVAGTAALRAGSGIGTANALETQVTTLAATTQTGGIVIANTGALTVGTVDGLVGVNAAADVTLTGGGIALQQGVSGANVTLDSTGSITRTGTGVVDVNGGTLTLDAGTGIGSAGTAIEMADVDQLRATTATGDVHLHQAAGADADDRLTLVDGNSTGTFNLRNDDGAIVVSDSNFGTGSLVLDTPHTIEFAVDSVSAGQDILLNTNIAPASVVGQNGQGTKLATIFRQPDIAGNTSRNLTLDAGRHFRMGACLAACADPARGAGQKLSVPGNLTINATTGTATVGDLAALAIAINANAANVVRRDGATLLDEGGAEVNDSGVDLIANSIILNLPGQMGVVGAGGTIIFATQDGSAVAQAPAGTIFGQALQGGGTLDAANFVGIAGNATNRTLDRSPEAITFETPTDSPIPVPEEVLIGGGLLNQLNQIAANEKPPWTKEILDEIECSIYEGEDPSAVPAECRGASGEAAAPDPRMQNEVIVEAKQIYVELLSDVVALKDSLQGAADAYRAATPQAQISGAGFRSYLEESPAQAQALGYVKQIGALFDKLEQLPGGSDQAAELQSWRGRLLEEITPNGMNPSELEQAIRARGTAEGPPLLALSDLP